MGEHWRKKGRNEGTYWVLKKRGGGVVWWEVGRGGNYLIDRKTSGKTKNSFQGRYGVNPMEIQRERRLKSDH